MNKKSRKLIEYYLKKNKEKAARLLLDWGEFDEALTVYFEIADEAFNQSNYEVAKRNYLNTSKIFISQNKFADANKMREFAFKCEENFLTQSKSETIETGFQKLANSNIDNASAIKELAQYQLTSGRLIFNALNIVGKKLAESLITSSEINANSRLNAAEINANANLESARLTSTSLNNIANSNQLVANKLSEAIKHTGENIYYGLEDLANSNLIGNEINSKAIINAAKIKAYTIKLASENIANSQILASENVSSSNFQASENIRKGQIYASDKLNEGLSNFSNTFKGVSEKQANAEVESAKIIGLKGNRQIVRALRGGGLSNGILSGVFHKVTGDVFRKGIMQSLEQNSHENV